MSMGTLPQKSTIQTNILELITTALFTKNSTNKGNYTLILIILAIILINLTILFYLMDIKATLITIVVKRLGIMIK